ncbi:hypothetical protein ACAH01_00585 [Halomicrobium sp. HM KBTZ05]|uniref:hypothetical protein n=1 Tax=Halomicrobium sp. HM KBTZ05 TaxID=3242663 RepID=UPI003557FA16
MRDTTTVLVAVVLVVGSLAAVPMAGLAAQTTETPTETSTTDTNTTDANATDANATAPGEQLAGVVGVQGAEIDGEVETRAYGIRVAQSESNDSKAAVVGQQVADVEQRLDELEQRRETLEAARENGSMSEGQYRARMARLAAETRTAERLANQSNETAQSLPAETLEANGVNATAIQTLRDRADQLSGPEVAAIARSIAGANASDGFGPERAGERGGDARNATERGDRPDGDRAGERGPRGGENETTADGADRGSEQPTDVGSADTGEQSADGEQTATDEQSEDATESDGERPGDDDRSDGGQGR